MRTGRPRTPVVDRFWAEVDRSDADGCWLWQGYRSPRGYGVLAGYDAAGNRKQLRAHRLSYEIANGPIPEPLIVMHSCDNPPCVNPAHLSLGTHLDNKQDSVRKGRIAVGPRHGARTMPERWVRGAANNRTKLTADQVLEIRARYAAGEMTQAALARAFAVKQSTISCIILRTTWAYLPV